MAKKKAPKVGGVDLSGFHFNNPTIQKAYEKWFIDSPLEAPVQIEYYDPTMTAAGQVKRTPVTTHLDPYEVERGKMMGKYKYGWNSGDDAIFKQHPIVKRKNIKHAKDIKAQLDATSSGGASKGAKGAAEQARVGLANTNARLIAAGKKPIGQEKRGTSLWGRLSDVLMRGDYAVSEGVRSALKDAEDGTNPISQVESFGKGAWQGASGKKKTTFSKVLHEQGFGKGVENLLHKAGADKGFDRGVSKSAGNIAEGAAGLGLDIGLDPTTYLGVGLVGHGGQALKLSEKAAAHLSEGEKIASRGKKTVHSFDDIQQELLSGKRHVLEKVKHSEEAQIHEPLRKMRASIENTRFQEIKRDLRTTPEYADKFDRGGVKNPASLAAANKELNAAAREAAQQEADHWMNTAIRNYQDTVAENIQHGLGIGVAGKNGKKATIVPAPVMSFLGNKVKDVDVVDRGLKTAAKYLQASAGVTPDLHTIRQSQTTAGITRSEFQLNRLRQGFSGMHGDIRENVWQQALNRNTHTGEDIVVDGVKQDAGEFLNTEVDRLDQAITGVTTGNTPMKAKELWAGMPPGWKDKLVTGKDGSVDIRKSMQNWGLQDGPRALHVAQQAYEHANAVRSVYVSAADSFGMRTLGQGALKNGGKIFDDMRKRGWREVNESKTHGLLKGVLFDPDTAQGMEKLIDLMGNERNWNTFMKKLARATSPIKYYLTVPNPGYHIRNAIGDAFINELDNTSLKSYHDAARVLHNVGEKYGGPKPLIMEEGNILQKAYARPNQEVLFHTAKPLLKPNGVKSTGVTDAEIYAGLNRYGITQNYTLSLTQSFADNPNMMKEAGGKIKGFMTSKSELRENYFRTAHFVELVKRNPSHAKTLEENMAWAAARIRKTHFDYTDFTKFEKQVLSNVIPFYKWTRKAVPLMTEIMLTNPGKAIIPTKAQLNLSAAAGYPNPLTNDPFPNAQGSIPNWMIQMGYLPGNPAAGLFGSHKPGMFALSSPFQDTMTQTVAPALGALASGNPKNIGNFFLQQANPLLKDPYELYQNENSFMSKGGRSVPIYRQDTKKKDLENYFINQIPYAHQVNRAFGGGSEKNNFGGFTSQLAGVYNQELTQSLQNGEMYRQQLEASSKWADVKKDLTKQFKAKGVTPPKTAAEWDRFLEAYAKQNGRKYKKPVRKSTKKKTYKMVL